MRAVRVKQKSELKDAESSIKLLAIFSILSICVTAFSLNIVIQSIVHIKILSAAALNIKSISLKIPLLWKAS